MSTGNPKDGGKYPPIDWSGDPVSAIGRYCSTQGWVFFWDPVEPWVDLRFAAVMYGIGVRSVEGNYAGGIDRIRTNNGIAVRLSDLNRARAQPPRGTDGTQDCETAGDGTSRV